MYCRCVVDSLGFDSWKGQDIFLYSKMSDCTGAYTASYSVGTWVLSLNIKWLVHEVDLSPPYIARVKNEWNCINVPLYALIVRTGPTVPSPSSGESITSHKMVELC